MYIYIYICMYVYIYIYIYIHVYLYTQPTPTANAGRMEKLFSDFPNRDLQRGVSLRANDIRVSCVYIYIYIYRERAREREMYIHVCVCTCVYVYISICISDFYIFKSSSDFPDRDPSRQKTCGETSVTRRRSPLGNRIRRN